MSWAKLLRYEAAWRLAAPALVRFDHARRAVRRRVRGSAQRVEAPPLDCTRKLKELLAGHYLAGRYASGARPVAWITSGFPVEILRPFGFHVVYPENHAALCAVQRCGVDLAKEAEGWGLSRDVCGYARCDLGSLLSDRTPVGRIPKPDALFACTNICQTVVYWYRILSRQLNVPLFVLDTPFVYGEPQDRAEQFIARQLDEVVALCERVTHRRVDMRAWTDTARMSRDASQLWGECLATGRSKPAPWTAFDQFIHIGPVVTLRGLAQCNAYYRMLLDELRDRVQRGIAAVPGERHRLIWDNLPIWYELRSVGGLLARNGFSLVAASYTNGWAETSGLFDPAEPLRSAARVYGRVFINRDLEYRARQLQALAREYRCEGVILHSNRSCKPYSVGQLGLARRLTEAGLRTLVVEADHIDARSFSKEQVEGRLSAFMESFAS